MGQQVTLKNVRLAFVQNLFDAKPFEDGDDPRYSCKFIVAKDSENHKTIEAALLKVAKEEWKDKAEAMIKALRGNSNKMCYLDGDSKPMWNGFEGMNYITANRAEKDGRPRLVDRRNNPVTAKDGLLYGGANVNAILDIWAQSGQFSGLRCTLMGVQFVSHGESFGGAATLSDDAFEDLGDMADTGSSGGEDDGLDAETRAMLGL